APDQQRQPLAPLLAQLGDAALVFLRRHGFRVGHGYRSAPMLMLRVNGERGSSRPRAMSTRTGPTGERQRTPTPTPVCQSGLPLKALPLSTNSAPPQVSLK